MDLFPAGDAMRLGTFPVDGHKDAPDFYQCQFEVCPKFRYRSRVLREYPELSTPSSTVSTPGARRQYPSSTPRVPLE